MVETTTEERRTLDDEHDAKPEQENHPAPDYSEMTPQEFYATFTARPDIRAILEELAKG